VKRARALLLRCYAAATAGSAIDAWPDILRRETQSLGLALHWRGLLADAPQVAAVRVAHALDMGPPGLQAWHASWPAHLEPAAVQLAAVAAGLLAGQEPLSILAAAVDGPGEDAGALVDADSCARMAVAGFDPETEVRLGNCAELLASAGDLVNRPAAPGRDAAASRYLILGLKWHAPAGD